jgi:hypothetical protein
MAEKSQPKAIKQDPRGELRRRHRAFVDSGTLASLRSEGRMMAFYVFCWADFRTCLLKVSLRGAARTIGVSPNSVIRGIQQLVQANALKLIRKTATGRSEYEILMTQKQNEGAHEPCTERTPPVYGAHTSRVRSAHTVWTVRTRAVCAAHTPGAPLQVIPLGIPSNTKGGISNSPTPGMAVLGNGQPVEKQGG